MFLILVLQAVLNSNFWLHFILIFRFWYLNYDIFSKIQIIIIILVPTVTPSAVWTQSPKIIWYIF